MLYRMLFLLVLIFNGAVNGVEAVIHHGPHFDYSKKLEEEILNFQKITPDYTPEQAKKYLESITEK